MNIDGTFPSKWIKAADLQGRRVNVRMANVKVEDVGDNEKKPCLYFVGKDKALVLNVTNANMIKEITGTSETDDWIGKSICLFVTKVEYGGKRVDGIRVDYPDAAPRPESLPPMPAPLPPPPVAAAPMDVDDIPF